MLEFDLDLEALRTARERREGEPSAVPHEADRRIARLERAFNRHGVPTLRVTHILDVHVVVVAPEEWHGIEAFAST